MSDFAFGLVFFALIACVNDVVPKYQNSKEKHEYIIEKFKDLPRCVKKSFRKNSRKHKTFFATTYPDRSSYKFISGLIRGEECIVVYRGFGCIFTVITIYDLSDCCIISSGILTKKLDSVEDFIYEAENLKPDSSCGLQPSD